MLTKANAFDNINELLANSKGDEEKTSKKIKKVVDK